MGNYHFILGYIYFNVIIFYKLFYPIQYEYHYNAKNIQFRN